MVCMQKGRKKKKSNVVVIIYIKVIKADYDIMASVIISGLIHLQHVKYKN